MSYNGETRFILHKNKCFFNFFFNPLFLEVLKSILEPHLLFC